jgi:hypothetical protein
MLDVASRRQQNGDMKRTVKRFEPVQLGKMLGVLYALMGLIFVPFFILFAAIGAFAQPNSGNQAGAGAIAVGVAAGMALAMPICYGVFGFIFGLISAAIYNLVARWIGGIEVEVE